MRVTDRLSAVKSLMTTDVFVLITKNRTLVFSDIQGMPLQEVVDDLDEILIELENYKNLVKSEIKYEKSLGA